MCVRYGNRIYLCMIKNLSSEWYSQISLFVVFNIIIIIFLGGGGAYVKNKYICVERVVFICV